MVRISNREVFRKVETKRIFILRKRKKLLSFFEHIINKVGLEHLTVTGHIEGREASEGSRPPT